MVKRWTARFWLVLVFPLWNFIVLPFAIWSALQASFLPYMALYGISPNELMRAWRSWSKPKEEYPDAA